VIDENAADGLANSFLAGVDPMLLEAIRRRAVVHHQIYSEATPVQLVVWDLSTSPYVDVVSARMLAEVEAAWASQGKQLRLAEAHADVRDILRAEGLEAHGSRIDRRTSVEDIVAAFRPVS